MAAWESTNSEDWERSGLADYLLYDYWVSYRAWYVLAGYHYYAETDSDFNILIDSALNKRLALECFEFDVAPRAEEERAEMEKNANRLHKFWINAGHINDPHPPQFFIEWALSKRIRPAWLDWAIERGLYTPKQETAQIATAPDYSTAWLIIQQAAINEFFNPRRNPDAKKEEVTDWIKEQSVAAGLPDSQNVASTIFTIIKPENHDPKKKRVEPQ